MIQKGETTICNKQEACAGSACFTNKGERRERGSGRLCSRGPEGRSIGQGLFHWPRAVPGARRVVGEILYEVGLFGEIGAVPEDGGAGFVNLIFGAAGVGAILEGEAIAER